MAKFAERLTILQDATEVLLDRLYFSRKEVIKHQMLANEKGLKFSQQICRSFPEPPQNIEKINGFDVFKTNVDPILNDLKRHYETIIDLLEYKELTLALLQEISDTTVSLKFDENSEYMIAYMNLLIGFIQIHLLLGRFNERKILVVLYDAAYRSKMNTAEPNFLRLTNYIQEFENTIRHLQDILAPNASRVGETLMNLVQTYQRCNSVQALRKEGALSLIHAQDKLTLPIQDHFRFELVYLGRFYLWIVYGFLFCPKGLKIECLDILKVALSDGWVATIYRDEVLYIHEEFENLFGWYTITNMKQSKSKKFVSEAAVAAVQSSGPTHIQRRIYLKQEINQLFHILSDRPGLLGPKIQVVFAALSLAKDEILWYFRHISNPAPKSKGKYAADQYTEYLIAELIYLTNEISGLIVKHKKLIQQYYVEYLSGPDCDRVKEDFESQQKVISVDVTVTRLFKAIVEDLAKPNLADLRDGKLIDLEPLRLNWLRCIGILSSFQSTVRIQKIKDLVTKVQFAVSHSRTVDRVEQSLKDFASLHELYYYKEQYMKLFQQYITSHPHIIHSLFKVVNSFPQNATRALPDQRDAIGKEVVATSANQLEKISDQIYRGFYAIYTHFFKLNMKVTFSYASNAQSSKILRQTAVELAGAESHLNPRNRKENQELHSWESNASRLCKSFSDMENLVIHNEAMCPRLFLRSVLKAKLTDFIQTISSPDANQVNRPSFILVHLRQMIAALKLIERYVNIDINHLIRQVLLHQFVDKSVLGNVGLLECLKADYKQEPIVIHRLAIWYHRLVFELPVQVIQNPQSTAVLASSTRRTLLSDPTLAIQADEFCDPQELIALCTIVGPYGVRFIDSLILRSIQKLIGKVKEFIASNRDGIDSIVNAGSKETAIAEALKKFRNLESFFPVVSQIGFGLFFRGLLKDALKNTTSSYLPNIQNLIRDISSATFPNYPMRPELLVADSFATDVGVSQFDIGLRAVIDTHLKNQDDRGIWEKLPYALATIFATNIWVGGRHIESHDAHSKNVHCVALASFQLLVGFSSALHYTNPDCRGQINKALVDYTSLASIHLLRHRPDAYPQPRINELWAMYIFLFKFTSYSSWVSLDALNSKIPYAMVRSAYLHLTTQRQAPQKSSATVETIPEDAAES